MKQLLILIALLGLMAPSGAGEDDPAPARLANGLPVEGAIQGTNAEGLVVLTPRGVIAYPWKYLSAGTRYRHERPFLAAQEIARSNAAIQAQAAAAAAAKAAAKASAKTNVAVKVTATNGTAQAGVKDSITNASPKTPAMPAQKEK